MLPTDSTSPHTFPTSHFQKAAEAGDFLITAEVMPPKGGDVSHMVDMAQRLRGRVHAVNITDGSRAVMRMSSMAAAAVLRQHGIEPICQMACRDRNRIAQTYDELFKPLRSRGILPIQNHSGSGHVYHLYVIRIAENCPLRSEALQAELSKRNIQTGIHYPIPCHLQPAFEYLNYPKGSFPNAETLSQQILSLPMFPGLKDNQISQVVDTISELIDSNPESAISA